MTDNTTRQTLVYPIILGIITLTSIAVLYSLQPIPQDPAYHHFADHRSLFNIPGAANVLSSLLFVFFGIWGIVETGRFIKKNKDSLVALQYIAFFIGVFLSGFGSMLYHADPNNYTLFWDRFPMTIAFMALFCSVITETIHEKTGDFMILPLVVIGFASVFFWFISEIEGKGDLRLYILVQFLPLLLIPLILIMYKAPQHYLKYIVPLFIFYLGSKIFEFFDMQLFSASQNLISGHTIKHLLAGFGVFFLVRYIKMRNTA